MVRFGALAAVVLLSGACAADVHRVADEGDDDGGTDGPGGTVASPDAAPAEPDQGAGGAPDPVATAEWTDAKTLVLTITEHADLGPYRFGFFEFSHGPDGWDGEDCIPGETDGYDLCHHVPADGVLSLTSVHPDVGGTIDALIEDETTIMTGPRAAGLTYVLIRETDPPKCWTWGYSVRRYVDALGCKDGYLW
jgi:hypothetical protein